MVTDSSTAAGEPAFAPAWPGAHALVIVLRIFCVLPFVTGAGDLLAGTKLLVLSGAVLPPAAALDPVLNSQVKFWGAIWFGYGLLLWWASLDLRGRAVVFRLLMGTLLLAGLGRALARYEYGAGPSALLAALLVEVVGSAALLLWHWRLLRGVGAGLTHQISGAAVRLFSRAQVRSWAR